MGRKIWKNLKRNEEWHNGDDLLHDNADYQITIITIFLFVEDRYYGKMVKSLVVKFLIVKLKCGKIHIPQH